MKYDFTTERLIVKEWHSDELQELHQSNLEEIMEEILVPDVTKRFPIMWRGNFDKKRARFWIQDRDSESKTLLAIDKESCKPLGYINFFKEGNRTQGTNLRLGYLVSHMLWNNGIATELVEGFLEWCRENGVRRVVAKVDPDNCASIRVLEKNNFLDKTGEINGVGLQYKYDF